MKTFLRHDIGPARRLGNTSGGKSLALHSPYPLGHAKFFLMITRTGLLLVLCFGLALPAWAGREAFEATPSLNAIEPASGDASAEAESHATATPEAHGESASGHGEKKPEPKKGKKLTATPPLPVVRIGGQVVERAKEAFATAEATVLPKALNDKRYPAQLQQRLALTPYVHSPRLGPANAQLSIIIMEDLACLSCTTASQQVSAAIEEFFQPPATPAVVSGSTATAVSITTQVVWVHAAASRFEPNNLAAFYGKVAARQGQFWVYRKKILEAPVRNTDTAFGILSALGLEPRTTRQIMLAEARRFYRELDGDAQLTRSLGVGNPPTVLVNGIRVGQHGLPLELLPDIIQYVKNRLNAGMIEPPR